MRRLWIARTLFATAATAAGLAVWAFVTGGFRVYVLGIPLSVRGADRAAFVAALCAVGGFYFNDPLQRRVELWRAGLQHELRAVLGTATLPVLPALAGLMALLLFVAAATFGTRAAGGADVYGYVSQSQLWLNGDLRIHQDFVRSIPWPNAEWSFSPLGYRPADDYTIVPTYPPGLPLLMALFSIAFGSSGVYYVPWVAGAALVWLTYALGVRLSGPVVGATAALSVAVSPIVLMMTFSAMSDVPVAACWMAALLFSAWQTRSGAVAAGLAAGLAVLIRPNLVPLASVPFVLAVWHSEDGRHRCFLRAAWFALAFVPFPLFVAWLFSELYGSPLTSGYGDNSVLFRLEHVRVNLALYPRWIWESQGAFAFMFLLTPLLLRHRDRRARLRWSFLAFVVFVFACYFLYLPFDAWWYTRFLLPAYPLMFLLGSDVVWTGSARFGARVQGAAAWLFALVMVSTGARQSYYNRVQDIGRGEQKYEEVGRHVERTLPPHAIVYAMQHSGTVRHYSDRLTIRYDYIEPDWLDRSIEHLQQTGYEPFLLLDNWEVPMFRERFASQKHVSVVAEDPEHKPCTHTTYLYRLVPGSGQPSAERIPQILGCK